MLKLWENPILSRQDRLDAACGEIERLRGLLDAAGDKVIELAGQQKVFAEALDDAWKVIITVEGESSDEADMLNALQERMERLSLYARGVVPPNTELTGRAAAGREGPR